MKTVLSNQTVDERPRVLTHSERMHSHCEGPQRHPVEGLQPHPLGKKKKWLQVDKWCGNRKELATVHTICSHEENRTKGVTLGSVTRWGLCTLTSPSTLLLFRRMVLLLNQNFLGRKIHPQGSDEVRHCLFSISSLERCIDSWRKWYWTCITFSCFDSASHNS